MIRERREVSDFYYEACFYKDRLLDKLVEIYGSLNKAGLSQGHSCAYFYTSSICKRINTIAEVCKKANISLTWFFDKNVKDHTQHLYLDDYIDLSPIRDLANSHKYVRLGTVQSKSAISILSRIKRGESNINLETLLYLSWYYNKKPIDLLFYPKVQELVA